MKDIENVCLEVDDLDSDHYQPISPDIVLTSSFKFKNFDHYVKVNSKEEFAYTYTRDGNPTLNLLEQKLARLESGEAAQMFASGMGAVSATILTLAKAGDHIIVVNTVYGSSVKLIKQLAKFNVECTKIDVNDTSEIFDYVKDNTSIIYFESPSSQKFEMLDLEMISEFARNRNIYTIIDNTWATPLLQPPLFMALM